MKTNIPYLLRRKIVVLGSLLALAALVAGCLVIPVDYYEVGSRHNVGTGTVAVLQLGMTTKEEVFLTLGEPDFTSEDGQHLGYAWTKVKALVVVGNRGDAVTRSYVLKMSLDSSNRLSQVRVLKDWGPKVNPQRELEDRPTI